MGIVINADQALTEASTHKLTVQNAINGIISAEPVEVTNTTADEYSDYVFTFTSDQEILNTDEIWIKFPMEYEPYLGMSEIKYKWSESTNYYIECGSARLGYELECTVD